MSETENSQLSTEYSLGRQLRSKREEKGLSIDDVSHHLKIDASLLRDFEEEREPSHNLPEVYCKGFLRNYARYVGVEVEPGQIKACRTSDIRPDQGHDEYAPKRSLLPYLLIAAVIIGIALFFVGGQPNHDDPSPVDNGMEQASPVTEPTPEQSAATEVPTPAVPTPEPTVTEEPAEPATTEASVADEKPIEPTPVSSETPAEEQPVESASTVESEQLAAAPITPAEPVEAEAAPAATRGTVTIRYIDRSFTQVTDGLGRVIVKRMLDAGAVEDFEGPLPLEINLGNAIGVRVQFNGEPFDHLNYIDDNNIAQFVLGGEE